VFVTVLKVVIPAVEQKLICRELEMSSNAPSHLADVSFPAAALAPVGLEGGYGNPQRATSLAMGAAGSEQGVAETAPTTIEPPLVFLWRHVLNDLIEKRPLAVGQIAARRRFCLEGRQRDHGWMT
jgi:hypothetical protein